MTRTFLLTLALSPLLLHAPAAAARRQQPPEAAAARWERYAFPGDEFSVELPAMPFVFHTLRSTDGSGFDQQPMRLFGLYADNVVYITAAFDNPRGGESHEDLARHVGGRFGLDNSQDFRAGALKGTEFRGALSGYTATTRVFKTKTRAYLVRAISADERHPSARRFLDSLTLSAAPPGRKIEQNAPAAGGGVATPRPAPAATDRDQRDDPRDAPAPAAGSDYDTDPRRVFKHSEVTRKAVLVMKPDPGFTEEARRNNVRGAVRLRAVLNSEGRVTNISVVRALPDGLTQRAVRAARHILFFPAVKDGRLVSQYVTIEYNFNIY